MNARTPCSVPFCPRSTKGAWAWWLCRDHWPLVDRALRLTRTRLKRRFRRLGLLEERDRWYRPLGPRATRAIAGVERRMIRQAIERATGIST